MIPLPKKLAHGIEAVLTIACDMSGRPLSGRELAEMQGLPPRYLEQLLQRLVRRGVLRGLRGPSGGYVLARERRRVTLADICAALIEESSEAEEHTSLSREVVAPAWKGAMRQLEQVLAGINVAALCAQAEDTSTRKGARERADFTI